MMAVLLTVFVCMVSAISYQIGRIQMKGAWQRSEALRKDMSKRGTRLRKVKINRG